MTKKQETIPNKIRVTKDEMFEHYKKCRPWVPNNVRVGKLAKFLGYVLRYQHVGGKQVPFYIKKEALEEKL